MMVIGIILLGLILGYIGKLNMEKDFPNTNLKNKLLKILIWIGYGINKNINLSDRYKTSNFEKNIILYTRKNFIFKSAEYFSYKYFFHYMIIPVTYLFYVKEKNILNSFLFFIVGNFIVHYYSEAKLNDRVKEKKEKILVGFFEFSSKFTLLINSGLNFKNALEGSIGDNEFSYYAINAYKKIQSGKSISFAFEEIALECRNPLINQYISCIIQSLKRGNDGIEGDLRKIMSENWRSRINFYKRWGEELKTKLIFPMMIIFIGILMILMIPVFLELRLLI